MKTAQQPASPSRATLFSYALGAVPFGIKDGGFSAFLLIFYAQVMGAPTQAVGLVIMAVLIFEACLDPLVGRLSDNLRSRWGRRHPFMYLSAIPAAVTFCLLWRPPEHLGEVGLVAYLGLMALLVRTFITGYEIPSAALAPELVSGYDARTRLLSYRYLMGWLGGLALYIAAMKVFLRPDAGHPVGQLNPAGYADYGVAAALVMLATMLASAIGTQRRVLISRAPPATGPQLRLGPEILAVLRHRTFASVLAATLFCAAAAGLSRAASLYFSLYFWEFTADQIALFAVAGVGSAFIAVALAQVVARRVEKPVAARALLVVGAAVASGAVVLRLLGVLPDNGSPWLFPLVLTQDVVAGACTITATILCSSMVADVVEDWELKTGRRSEGLFFAAVAFVNKAVSGIGISAAALLLALAQFPQQARPGEVPADALLRLGMTYAPAIFLLYAAAAYALRGYGITRRMHEQTLRRLAELREEKGE
ncbi:MFS transporter [Phenylobacterium sp. SCN 70-31]|uniref:MFS transporter n=1 Tax=Phenylobacterium sp. SCN 70-31 TaxID=1660129 RepID=UPI00086F2214|nr:MFS transporter [Phenylobacterium sp. SCN 70-31]ODT89913.1 MAG: hypothetical protein ABS78_00845 [Phenylobacterium sp. SCN 70-31]